MKSRADTNKKKKLFCGFFFFVKNEYDLKKQYFNAIFVCAN